MAKTAFLFSGQGAQAPGMMKEYYDAVPGAKGVFDIANDALGRSISGLCFEGSQEDLNLTHNTQPCVLAADLAAYEAARSAGYRPDAVAGFSLGEYAALVAAGCMGIEDAFRIVQLRADAMQEAVPVGEGAMAAVMKVELPDLRAMCDAIDGYVVPANINSPSQIVVSGEAGAVDALFAECKERHIRAMKLPVSAPFHCDLMAPAAEKLAEAIAGLDLRDPSVPVYLNVDARPITTAEGLAEKMVAQAKSPVLWRETLENMWADGCDAFLECGPGATLSGFVKKTLKEAEVLELRGSANN